MAADLGRNYIDGASPFDHCYIDVVMEKGFEEFQLFAQKAENLVCQRRLQQEPQYQGLHTAKGGCHGFDHHLDRRRNAYRKTL